MLGLDKDRRGEGRERRCREGVREGRRVYVNEVSSEKDALADRENQERGGRRKVKGRFAVEK